MLLVQRGIRPRVLLSTLVIAAKHDGGRFRPRTPPFHSLCDSYTIMTGNAAQIGACALLPTSSFRGSSWAASSFNRLGQSEAPSSSSRNQLLIQPVSHIVAHTRVYQSILQKSAGYTAPARCSRRWVSPLLATTA